MIGMLLLYFNTVSTTTQNLTDGSLNRSIFNNSLRSRYSLERPSLTTWFIHFLGVLFLSFELFKMCCLIDVHAWSRTLLFFLEDAALRFGNSVVISHVFTRSILQLQETMRSGQMQLGPECVFSSSESPVFCPLISPGFDLLLSILVTGMTVYQLNLLKKRSSSTPRYNLDTPAKVSVDPVIHRGHQHPV